MICMYVTRACMCYLFFVINFYMYTINLEIRNTNQDIDCNDDFITHLINFIKNSV